jgi:hypothetical protein
MKLLAKTQRSFTLLPMRKRATTFILIVCVASAFAVTSHAQGRLSQSQTELSNTTISGYVQDGIFDSSQNPNEAGNRPLQEFFHHQGNGNTSLSPVLPTPPIVYGGLVMFSIGVTFPTSFDTGSDSVEFYSTGADLMEASRSTTLIDQPVMPLIPPTPVGNSFSIQPVPEPSTFALGSLALALIAILRFKKQQRA